MLQHPDFVVCRPKTNNYFSLMHKDFGIKLSLDFRKSFENGVLIGYRHLEINTSPHYHYNNYLHNGNDFTPSNSIKTVIEILTYLGIKQREYNELNVCNIEFGLNIIPETDIKNLINGLYFYKKTRFIIPDPIKKPFYKESDTSEEKTIKAYAKGIQCHEVLNAPEIDIDTFRFEVKHKKSRPTKTILKKTKVTVDDLLNLETYKIFSQELINEWERTLLINLEPDLNVLKSDEVEYIQNAKTIDFWTEMIQPKYRNKFGRYKEKYYSILQSKNNLHHLIKMQIIDKLFSFSSGAISPQKNTINKRKVHFGKTHSQLLKCELAPLNQNNRVCLVTGLDISMQKKVSKFLCIAGLKHYKENKPEIYKDLEKRFLTEKQKGKNLDRQIYFIAHNIRNTKTNKEHNQKQFEKRNYKSNQLQFSF